MQAKLAALRARKAACPILYFSTAKRPHQRDFFYDKHPITFVKAGRRGGKTFAIIARTVAAMTGFEPVDLPGMLAMLPRPPVKVRHWCLDLTRTGKAEVILPFYQSLIPERMLDTKNGRRGFNTETGVLRLKNGSQMSLMSYELGKGKGEAAEVDVVNFDEVPPEALYDSQKARILTRPKGFMWIAGTLHSVMPWPIQWVERRIIRGGDGDAVSCHSFDTQENLTALTEERGGADSAEMADRQKLIIDSWSDDQKAVFLGGEGDWAGGTVYRGYSESRNAYAVPGVTQDHFWALARAGRGEIWCGMDHGGSAATVVVYVYIAKCPIESMQIVEGDYVQVDEYYRENARVIHHLPRLQEMHKHWQPSGYFCDPHMWDDDGPVRGMSPAVLYTDRTRLRDFISGLPDMQGVSIDFSTMLGPLHRGRNSAGAVEAGIQIMTAMLMPRQGVFPWPRYRLLRGHCKMTNRGFLEWQRKPDAALRVGEDRYSHHMKDPMDAVRYLGMAQPDQAAPVVSDGMAVPCDPMTGVAMNDLCALQGAGAY